MGLSLPELWTLDYAAAYLWGRMASEAGVRDAAPAEGAAATVGRTVSAGPSAASGQLMARAGLPGASGPPVAPGGLLRAGRPATARAAGDEGAVGAARSEAGAVGWGGSVLVIAPETARKAVLARVPHGSVEAGGDVEWDAGLWFRPDKGWVQRLGEVRQRLAFGAPLAVISGGRLARRGRAVSARCISVRARQLGFRIEGVLGFGSPAMIAAAVCARAARATGRLDLADRAEAMYRLAVRPARSAVLAVSTLVLLTR
jgi:hypothetical protein